MINRTRSSAAAIGLFFMSCLFSCGHQEHTIDFEVAKQAYERHDYPTALKGIKPRAEQRDSDAQRLLGMMYESGNGVPKDPQEALRLYRLAAEKKNAEAEKLIAEIYDEGKGVPIDKPEALKWFRRSSEHGNGKASFELGDRYYRGNGVTANRYEAVKLGALSAKQGSLLGYFLAEGAYNPKEPQPQDERELRKWLKFGADNSVATAQVRLGAFYYDAKNYTEAMRLFTLAAKQEGEWAKSNISVHLAESLLGDMYESGRGVAVDHAEAVKWFRLAADGKHADGQFKMGIALVKGLGVTQDYSEGARYYRMAAEQGHRSAQAALGAMCFLGNGIPQDYVQAHLWSNLASVDGDELSLKLRNGIEKKMTPTQVAEAQRLARDWKPKNGE